MNPSGLVKNIVTTRFWFHPKLSPAVIVSHISDTLKSVKQTQVRAMLA